MEVARRCGIDHLCGRDRERILRSYKQQRKIQFRGCLEYNGWLCLFDFYVSDQEKIAIESKEAIPVTLLSCA